MRVWHQFLVPYLDRQRLLGAHRELCALRGKGWGKPHSVVNYVFNHKPDLLVAYHLVVIIEMEKRGYNVDPNWKNPNWRGKILGQSDWVEEFEYGKKEPFWSTLAADAINHGDMIYPEHDAEYLNECITLLKEKGAACDWESIEKYKYLYL